MADNLNVVLQAARGRFHTLEQARLWYDTQPLPGFGGGLTARDLVELGRADDVLEYMKAVDAGVHT